MINLTKDNFKEEAENSDMPLIIDFWASWCSPCQALAPVFEELSKEYKSKLKFAKVNTEEETGLTARFSIRGIPALIIYQKGKEIDRILGFSSKEALKQKIEFILEQIP